MVIDFGSAWNAVISALGRIVAFVSTTYVKLGNLSVSLLTLFIAALVVEIILLWYIPWNGDE